MKLKDFLNSINYDKKPLLDGDESDQKFYPAYVVNRSLSYFGDTIFYANEINCNPFLDQKAQFDFYRLSIRKKKRFSLWAKKEENEDIALIKEAFGYSEAKAREVLNIIRPQELDKIKKSLDKGGHKI